MNTVLSGSRKTPAFVHVSLLQPRYFCKRRKRKRDLWKNMRFTQNLIYYPETWRLEQDIPKPPLPQDVQSRSGLGVGPSFLQSLALCFLTTAWDFEGKSMGSFPDCNGGNFESTEMGVLLFDWEKYHLNMPCLNDEKEKKEKKEGGRRERGRNKKTLSNQSIPKDLNENGKEKELQMY